MEKQRHNLSLDETLMTSSSLVSNNGKQIDESSTDIIKTQVVQAKTPFIAAVFALMAGLLGAGMFNLPFRITKIGVGIFLLYILVGAIFSYIGCLLLHKLIKKTTLNSYSQICESAFGPTMKRLSQLCLILFPWGNTICYQVIMSQFIIQMLDDVFKVKSDNYLFRLIINLVLICTNFILIQFKNIVILQKISIIGVLSVTYNVVTIFALFFVGFTYYGDTEIQYDNIFHYNWQIVPLTAFGDQAFSSHTQALATILFCFINHQLVFPTCKNIEIPSKLNACFYISVSCTMILYLATGLSGYLLLFPHQDQRPISPMILTSINTTSMLFGKLLIVITLYLALPLNLFPARTILFESLGLKKTTLNHYILSICLAGIGCAIAITFVNINSYFGLIGGTAGVLMGGGIPALCYWKIIIRQQPKQDFLHPDNLFNLTVIPFCLIVSILAFIGAILSVVMPNK